MNPVLSIALRSFSVQVNCKQLLHHLLLCAAILALLGSARPANSQQVKATVTNTINIQTNGGSAYLNYVALSPDGKTLWAPVGYEPFNGTFWLIDVASETLNSNSVISDGTEGLIFTPDGQRAIFLAELPAYTYPYYPPIALGTISVSDPPCCAFGISIYDPSNLALPVDMIFAGNQFFLYGPGYTGPGLLVGISIADVYDPSVTSVTNVANWTGTPAAVPAGSLAGTLLLPGYSSCANGKNPTCTGASLYLMNPQSLTITKTLVLSQDQGDSRGQDVVVSPDGKYAYVSVITGPIDNSEPETAGIWIVDLETSQTVTFVPMGATHDSIVQELLSTDGKHLLLSTASQPFADYTTSILNTSKWTVEGAFNNSAFGVSSMAIAQDGSKAFVPYDTYSSTSGSGVAVQVISFSPSLGSPGPNIASLNTTYGAPYSVVTLSGSNFGASKGLGSVTFNGVVAPTYYWSDKNILATVPSNATSGNLVVKAGGQTSNAIYFNVWPMPSISGISPTSGPVGTVVTISGENLEDFGNHGTVTLGGKSVPFVAPTNAAIYATVPSGAVTGKFHIVVNDTGINTPTFTVTK